MNSVPDCELKELTRNFFKHWQDNLKPTIASFFSKHVQTCSKHDAIKPNDDIIFFKTS